MKVLSRTTLVMGVAAALVGVYATGNLVWFFADRAACIDFPLTGCSGMITWRDRLGFSDLGIALVTGAVAALTFVASVGAIKSALEPLPPEED